MTDTGIRLDTPRSLIAAARARRLNMFIGAGFSKNISPSMPDASELIKIAGRYAKIDDRLLSIHTSNDYMLIAEYLEIEGVIQQAIAELERLLHDKAYSVSASRPHIQLTEMDCSMIFTMNWDWWIEKAFENRGARHRVARTAGEIPFHRCLGCEPIREVEFRRQQSLSTMVIYPIMTPLYFQFARILTE